MKKQNLTYLNGLAISCLATGLVDEAQPAFQLISDVAPAHAAGAIGLASVELARGNYDAACKILQESADELGDNSDRTKNILMHALIASNRFEEAENLMSRDAANDETEYLAQSHKFFGTGDPRRLKN